MKQEIKTGIIVGIAFALLYLLAGAGAYYFIASAEQDPCQWPGLEIVDCSFSHNLFYFSETLRNSMRSFEHWVNSTPEVLSSSFTALIVSHLLLGFSVGFIAGYARHCLYRVRKQ